MKKLLTLDEWARVESVMPDATRPLINAPPHASSWIPIEHLLALMQAPRLLGREDWENVCRECGRLETISHLRTVHRIFIQVLNPTWVIRRSQSLWGAYYRDFGEVPKVTAHGPRDVTFRFTGLGANASFWLNMEGAMAAICDLTRVSNATRVVREGGGDREYMILQVAWER